MLKNKWNSVRDVCTPQRKNKLTFYYIMSDSISLCVNRSVQSHVMDSCRNMQNSVFGIMWDSVYER